MRHKGPELAHPIPRMPVLGWQSFAGAKRTEMPCLLDHPGLQFTTSGRAGILLSLESLGLGDGAAVLLPTYHCPSMVAPVLQCGARPLLYPLTAAGAPDLKWLEQQDLSGVRVMLVVHFFGLPQAMACWLAWCRARNIVLIEDCAHAMFGSSDGQAIGSWGDFAIASLTKFLPVVEGGCLIVNNRAAPGTGAGLAGCRIGTRVRCAADMVEIGARHGRLLGLNTLILGTLAALKTLRPNRNPAASSKASLPLMASPSPGEVAAASSAQRDLGDDFRLDLAKAHRALASPCRRLALGLPRQRITEQRRRNYRFLLQGLEGHAGLRPLSPQLPDDCAPYVFPLWVDQPDPAYLELRRLGVPVLRWDRIWGGTPEVQGDQGPLWSHHVLQLSCHQDLRTAELAQVVSTVRRLFSTIALTSHSAPPQHPVT